MPDRKCYDCGKALAKSLVDHAYRYDHGMPIQLRSITKWSCTCGYCEVDIPRMGPLHETIAQELAKADSSRVAMSFSFKEGSRGVADGVWSVAMVSSTP